MAEAPLKALRSPLSSQKIVFSGLVFRFASSLLITALLGRFLSPAEYGFFSLVAMLAVVVRDLLELGVSNLVTREIIREPGRERLMIEGLMGWRALASTVLSIGLLIFAFTQEDPVRFALILGLAVVTPSAILLAQVPVFQARQALLAPTFLGLALQLLFIVAILTLQWTGLGGILLCWLIIVRELLNNLGYHWLARSLLPFRPRIGRLTREVRSFLGQALIFSSAILLHGLYFYSDILLVYWMRGEEELGAYAAAFRIINPVLDLPYMLMMPMVPLLTLQAAAPGGLRRLVSRICLLAMGIGLVGTVAGILTARDILTVLYGGLYLEGPLAAHAAFAWQSVAVSATCLSAPLVMALLALRQERRLLWISAAGLLFNLVANLLLIPRMGFTGAAMTTAATELLVCLCMLGVFGRLQGFEIRASWGLVLLPAMAAGAAIAWIPWSAFPRTAAATAAGAVAVLAILASPTAQWVKDRCGKLS